MRPPEPEKPKFPIHDDGTHWRLKRPLVGELYASHNQLRECLSYYALANGYSLWYERSCKTSIIARCGTRPPNISDPDKGKQKKNKRFPAKQQKCTFRLYAKWMPDEGSMQILSLVDEHSCARNFKYGSLINYKWIGRHFANRIRAQPEIKLCAIQDLVMKKYRCTISHHQARRARTYALTEFERTLEEHYGQLWSYGEAILRTNPGSTVQLGVTTNPDGKTYFDRFYTCFAGLKQGWRTGCRKVVALDGCFLKKPCSGEILSAVGRDGNNQVYPIAWAIVNVENKQNWTWFLSLLSDDLDCPDGAELTLISDQHKGLIEAVKDVMPRSEHRQCARHIYENFRKVYSGVEFRHLFWKAAKSSYQAQYEAAMKEIQVANPNAYKYLMERNPKSWCRAFFEIHRGCEAVENGFSECWNSVLLKVRNKPIITLLEALKIIVMVRLETIREQSERWQHDVCPMIRQKLDDIKRDRTCWLVIHAGGAIFEVRNYNDAYTVDMDEQSCSCRMWQLSGIPCVHGVQAIYKCNMEPEDYISGWFRKLVYHEAYNKIIYPVGGMDTWPSTDRPKPLPPKARTMPGRPRKKRIRAAHEPRVGSTKVTKHGIKMTCRKCWLVGHNARTCTSEQKERPPHIPKPRQKKPKPTSEPNQSQNQSSDHENPPNQTESQPIYHENPPNQTESQPINHESQPFESQPFESQPFESQEFESNVASQTQETEERPLSPGRRYRYTLAGHKFVTAGNVVKDGNSISEKGGTSSAGKVIRKIGMGTFSTQPKASQTTDRISNSTLQLAKPPIGTQESVNTGAKKAKKVQVVKKRPPSYRCLRQRLAKVTPGPGLTEEDAMIVE